MFQQERILIGIAGGTGSGKTTVAHRVAKAIRRHTTTMDMDSYYKDLAHLPLEERLKNNFDHPDSIDVALFVSHLNALKRGESIEKPLYSFEKHTRKPHTETVTPTQVIIVEGVLVLAIKEVRDILDAKIFVDTDDDVRMIRRIRRDVNERGRQLDGIIEQYLTTVRPMHLSFVEPSKRYADIIIPKGGNNEIAISMITSHLRTWLLESGERSEEEAPQRLSKV